MTTKIKNLQAPYLDHYGYCVSTDFEVHRNWLAITYSLPVKEWYKNDISQWTLDYPPLFALFEFIFSLFAQYFDEKMLIIENLNYKSKMTVLFQRLTVVFTDLLFAYSIKECLNELRKKIDLKQSNFHLIFIIIFGNAGLLLVDHIHFQYNGFLFGVLLLSIARILQRRNLEGAFWFCVLLNLKHIYLYIAPAYFVYLYRMECARENNTGKVKWLSLPKRNCISLASIVIFVFLVSFGPFIALGQLQQVLFRLFPFKRGLCHSYWAPNLWALYNFMDKFLTVLGLKLGYVADVNRGSMTSGLVKEYEHTILPSIAPIHTFLLTVITMLPCLLKLWKSSNNPWQFVRSLTMCGFCSFLFGWHVHEKAILLIILPLSLLSLLSREETKYFTILNVISQYSLFPLIFTPEETVLKVTALLLHSSLLFSLLEKYWRSRFKPSSFLNMYELLYILGLLFVFLYNQFIHHLLGLHISLPFLPLMITSVYCSIGILYCWFGLYKFMLNI
ncbi:putative dolichyl pyrophosphate Glc1Man9GlcNAc2 alpha-1,3-glucosyltransferase [Armadillidium nasatum]|uniref:Alpha-1,3-glucosyltransferase n=1 Tax=Armadillidium nasatum TaxID=96803 RepID=A0A5N5THY9_9CRUS|nr:putative dolichyl pyrophosphate Glc1Man9GlcNAc2 alpha-1,3-glucosyltransferase [Armadillidium nasatum]